MKNYFSFLTRNWWLKLLALALALAVFYGVRSSIRGSAHGIEGSSIFTRGQSDANR